MTDLSVRVVTAGVGLVLFLAFAVWGFIPFLFFIWFLALISACEFWLALQRTGRPASLIFTFAGVLGPAAPFLLVPIARRVIAIIAIGFFLFGLLYELIHSWVYKELRTSERIAFGLLAGFYVSFFGGLTLLRAGVGSQVGVLQPTGAYPGLFNILTVCGCVWVGDAAAYFVGRMGRRILAAHVSPAKTLEGAVFAVSASLIVGILLGADFFSNGLLGAVLGAAGGLGGLIGDLLESAIKRSLGIKDFSGLLPGHGGLLDRFDSLLFAAPICSFILWLWRPL